MSPSVKTCLLLYICILKNSNQKLLSGAMHNNFNNMLLIAGIDNEILYFIFHVNDVKLSM